MKTSILIVASLFVATVIPARAGTPALKASVTGTVQTQVLTSPTTGKIHTAKLDNKRIFEEYQVSKADYELVVDIENSGFLELLPKHTGGGLPTIKIVTTGSKFAQVIDTNIHSIKLVTDLGTNTATNLFQNLAGEIAGAVHYAGSINSPVFDKYVYSVVGSGTDVPTNGSAILKFKVTGKGFFTQAP